MSIYRKSCRQTERVTMKKLYSYGKSVTDIATQLRVDESIVKEVIEGVWDSTEKALTLAAMEKNKQATIGKADAESNKIAQIAAAAAAAINGQSPVVDQAALRAKIEAEVRAEMAAEATPVVEELTPQQRGANTRKANAEQAAQDAADDEAMKVLDDEEAA
jgi:hypothetical protein